MYEMQTQAHICDKCGDDHGGTVTCLEVKLAEQLAELRELYDIDTQCLRAERDDARERHTQTIIEKDRWRAMAEEKWGLRREVEELLGVSEGECSDAQFARGVDRLRKVIAENAANTARHVATTPPSGR